MAIKRHLRNLVPMWVRLARRHLQNRMLNEQQHREFTNRQAFFRAASTALAFNRISGDYAEFGCNGGDTFGMAYRELRSRNISATLWAFDSFAGLPPQALPEDEHPVWVAGEMATSLADFHAVCAAYGMTADVDYRIVQGYYNESLRDSRLQNRDLPANLALAYVDCDLYSSTIDVLRFLEPRFKQGMILAFDDYYCWTEKFVSGERNACNEIFANHPRFRLVPYIQYGWHGMSFVLEDNRLLKAADAGVHF